MSRDHLTYWKCRRCQGAGEVIVGYEGIERCPDCDGTGNGLVDGRARAYAREIDRIRRRKAGDEDTP